jgi:hypothetical protein
MRDVIAINSKHPLVGTWRPDDEDESAEYTITAAAGGFTFTVSGVDRYDGEPFEVSNVTWDGNVLRFRSVMRSTNWVLEHEFRSLGDNDVEHRYTRCEVWHRVAPK